METRQHHLQILLLSTRAISNSSTYKTLLVHKFYIYQTKNPIQPVHILLKHYTDTSWYTNIHTFAIAEVSIDFLWRYKEVEHLPQSILKVHLTVSESNNDLVKF